MKLNINDGKGLLYDLLSRLKSHLVGFLSSYASLFPTACRTIPGYLQLLYQRKMIKVGYNWKDL